MNATRDSPQAVEIVSFGPFRLSVSERLLVKGNDSVAVGGRALDILIALVKRAGEVVSRRELISSVWPDVTVEDANLRVHVANLRKALGDGEGGARYIVNIPGRGYCFVAPIQRQLNRDAPNAAPSDDAGPPKLPALLSRIVGRQETIAGLSSLVMSQRFVSIVGPGGMGKTTVAVAIAHALRQDFDDAVYFVDLSGISDPALVPSAVASAISSFVQTRDPVSGLLAFLADRRSLIVLDNCEHLIDAVAVLAERLFNGAAQLHLLTTTREALRVEGENVHLLLPLDSPLDETGLTATRALHSSAVQLFMQSATSSGYRRELTDRDAPAVAEICHRLDGIPLAIELAGSRVGAYGIRETAKLLGNRFKLLWQGRRSALPRHQTLQAMLDWSYNLLSEDEQTVLCRLSIFAGIFTLEDALAVAGEDGTSEAVVAEAVANLVSKSLIGISDVNGVTFHRLLDTTRAYAAAKLVERGAWDAFAKRHASHFADYFDAYEMRVMVGRDTSAYSAHIDNVRAALDWSFSDAGDVEIGVRLAARTASLLLNLSLFNECENWCRGGLDALPTAHQGARTELMLQEALAISSMFTHGNGEEVRVAIHRGLELVETLKDGHYYLRLLAGLNVFLIRTGDFRGALAVSKRSVAIAEEFGEIGGTAIAEWMLGVANHLIGDQAAAERHCERGLELANDAGQISFDFFGYDHRVRALVALARTLWLRGKSERALGYAHQAIAEAAARNHPITVCISYIYTIPVFLLTGDFHEAEKHIEILIAHSAKYSLEPYHAVGLAFKGELMIARGEPAAGVALLRKSLETFNANRHHVLTAVFNRALAEGLAGSSQFKEAIATVTSAIADQEQTGENFDFPDLLRAKGEILLASPQPDVIAAEATLVRSLVWARRQSALGWELRAVIPLARMWAEQGRCVEARTMLADVHKRFTEGFDTTDLKRATALLSDLDAMRSSDK